MSHLFVLNKFKKEDFDGRYQIGVLEYGVDE